MGIDIDLGLRTIILYTVPKAIDFPRHNMNCSLENVLLCGIFHVVSCFPLHFMLYRENLDYFSDSVYTVSDTRVSLLANHIQL